MRGAGGLVPAAPGTPHGERDGARPRPALPPVRAPPAAASALVGFGRMLFAPSTYRTSTPFSPHSPVPPHAVPAQIRLQVM